MRALSHTQATIQAQETKDIKSFELQTKAEAMSSDMQEEFMINILSAPVTELLDSHIGKSLKISCA